MKKILICLLFIFNSSACMASYERIVSLGPAVTEELYLLGAGDKIVGVTTYCIKPKGVEEKQKIGAVTEVDVEKIVRLAPDLVIATPLTDVKQVEKLKSMGINVISLRLANSFSDICDQFLELGKIVDREKEALGIISKSQEEVNKVVDSVKGLPKVKVFIQVGTRPLFTMTKDSFVNDYIELAGGINIAGEERSGFYSMEEVLKKNPDVILIVGMEFASEEEKKSWQRFKQLKAAAENRIYALESYKFCSPTPISFAGMLEEIEKILHPKYGQKTF